MRKREREQRQPRAKEVDDEAFFEVDDYDDDDDDDVEAGLEDAPANSSVVGARRVAATARRVARTLQLN